jgi:hypothetical protein
MNKYARLSLCLAGLVILALPTSADAVPFTWTGFYIGGNAGGGWGGESTSVDLEGFNYFAANPAPGEVTKVGDDAAFIGGGQIGYNYAINRIVAGIEADFSGFDIRAAKIPASSKADWGSDTRVSVELNWLATVRGRLGLAMDRWLVYGTGGAAFSDGEYRNHDFCNRVPPLRRRVARRYRRHGYWMDGGRGRGICVEAELDIQGGVSVRTFRWGGLFGNSPLPCTKRPRELQILRQLGRVQHRPSWPQR